MNENNTTTSIRTLRLIITAMVTGCCIFGGAIIFSASRMGKTILDVPAVPIVVAVVAGLALLVAFLVLPLVLLKPTADVEERRKLKAFGMQLLVRAGIVEGAMVLCLISYLLTRSDLVLGCGAALTIALLILRPSEATYEKWRSVAG